MGLCACGCGETTPLATATRRREGVVKGEPMRFLFGHSLRVNGRRRGTLTERFWRSVEKTDAGCWNWRGSVNTHGYGQIRAASGEYTTAHRVSWELTNGPIVDGLWVLHRCDNPRCVRPDHLFLGTPADNAQDMYAKKRDRHSRRQAAEAQR